MTPLRALASTTFRSLRTRNYRLYFFSQIVSVSGTWMQSVAQAWLVLRLAPPARQGIDLGLVTALQFLPMLLFGTYGGLVADRVDKRRLLYATQVVAGTLALALGLLTAFHMVHLWHVFLLATLLGFVNMVDNPARQTFVLEMVGRDDLPNAVSLNSVVMNSARVIGPAIGGVLIAVVGTLAYNFQVVLALFAKFTFHGGPGAYSALTSLMGGGAVLGGLVVASRSRPDIHRLTALGLGFGVLILAVALSPTLVVACIVLVPMGALSIAFIATANATLQLRADPTMRGRVMALYAIAFLGTTPIGSPLVGWISQAASPRVALAVGAAATVAASFVTRRRHLRDHLRRSGPEPVVEEVEPGTELGVA